MPSKTQQLEAELHANQSAMLELESQLADSQAMLHDTTAALEFQRNRARRNGIRLIATTMEVYRMRGYIDRVREMDKDRISVDERSTQEIPTMSDLLDMSDRQFGKTIDSMDDQDLAEILGKPKF